MASCSGTAPVVCTRPVAEQILRVSRVPPRRRSRPRRLASFRVAPLPRGARRRGAARERARRDRLGRRGPPVRGRDAGLHAEPRRGGRGPAGRARGRARRRRRRRRHGREPRAALRPRAAARDRGAARGRADRRAAGAVALPAVRGGAQLPGAPPSHALRAGPPRSRAHRERPAAGHRRLALQREVRARFRLEGERGASRRPPFRGQWGIAQDDEGRLYTKHNSAFLFVDLFPASISRAIRPRIRARGGRAVRRVARERGDGARRPRRGRGRAKTRTCPDVLAAGRAAERAPPRSPASR